jgi:hypothetical protein
LRFVPVVVLAFTLLAACGDEGSSTGPLSNSSTSTSTGSSGSGSTGTTSSTGTATLRWAEPTTNTNGTPLTDLAGYEIYYGESASNLSDTVHLSGATTTQYVINNLTSGTWYFAIKSLTSTGRESSMSEVVSLTIT